jgi:MoaA/NifB/PqqE/SkfB family radical SAM enzyme
LKSFLRLRKDRTHVAPPPEPPARRPGPSAAQRAINVLALVDTIDVCHLKCPTCIRGLRGLPNSAKTMPLDLFRRIVAKIDREGFQNVGLFNWTEPFLNPRLPEYIEIVKSHNIGCWVSTSFSLRRIPTLEASLRAGIDLLVVSVSGFEQDVYEINHRDGTIEYVKENLRAAAALKHGLSLPGIVRLRFIKFHYNHAQEAKLKAFADELGIDFEVVNGSGDPTKDSVVHTSKYYEGIVAAARSERKFDEPGKVCPLMFGQIAMNHEGKLSLCCGFPQYDVLQVGSYLDLTYEEILMRRYAHPMCSTCDFPRRVATANDQAVMLDAVRYRLGMTPATTAE